MLPPGIHLVYHGVIKGPYARELSLLLLALGACAVFLGAAVALPFWAAQFAAAALLSVCVCIVVVGLLVSRVAARLNDLQDAAAFSLLYGGQAPASDFFMSGAAATPSLQLLLQKVLRLCRPNRILELGSGQTTKILAQYCRDNPDCRVFTFEESAEWHERLSAQLAPCERHDYRVLKVQATQFTTARREIETYWYGVDPRPLAQSGFDFILIDGPDGPSPLAKYARSGILQWLPDVLASRFVVAFDDAERYGEASTVAVFEAALRANGIKAIRFAVHGVKTQIVFCSPNWAFLRSV